MDEPFKPGTLITLGGCITAEIVIVNAVRHAFDFGPRWFTFTLAMVIAAAAFAVTRKRSSGEQISKRVHWIVLILIIVLNGCLVYTSAFGIQNNVIAPPSEATTSFAVPGGDRIEDLTFRSSW